MGTSSVRGSEGKVVTGPDGRIEVVLDFENPDRALGVRRDGETVIEPSPIGIGTLHGRFPDAFELVDADRRTVTDEYRTTYGKRRERRHDAVEATYTFEDDTEHAVAFDVRVAADGVAYRYRVEGDGAMLVFGVENGEAVNEWSGVRFPQDTVSWVFPYAHNHESSVRTLPALEAAGEFHPPGLFQTGDDAWVLLAESNVDGTYAASRLVTDAGDSQYRFNLPPETSVSASLPLTTPWRVALVGDLATVTESTLVTDLADDRAVEDAEWVEPGRVSWTWWAESDSPRDFERQKEYVEYAAERGWEYHLVDEGWDPAWVPELVEYADERGVGIFLWSHWTRLNSQEKRESRLAEWASWGVEGVKVDFMDSDDQGRLQFYDDLMAATAEHELLLNFHGSVIPTGLERRWPHVMTYEGVLGAEHYKWATLSPEHNTVLPFTRNVVGPMDYTPVTFSADSRRTTAGHELALSVVFESGLQHFADSLESYAARPLAESFLEAVPAAWDETVFLRGRPGSEATFARRRGDEWFVGAITAGPDRTIDVPLSFLDGERDVRVVRDDGHGETLVQETGAYAPGDSLRVQVPENGGFVARIE